MATGHETTKKPGVFLNDEGQYELAPGHRLPGWTVDALLEEGKVEEARAELERLVVEGAESGGLREMNEELMNEILTAVRGRTVLQDR